jgi:hypothetical protein
VTPRAGDSPTVAVFLGPSLAREAAAAILDADYLPPAQFGDVYRLIGSGLGAIVVLDGVFHGRAPVWQRELLAAMRAGIRVYGAASMGALRAAELHSYGMIGFGTVYQWYIAGEIDGDDEVALLHAGPEQRYQPLTEPLVNVRATLCAAVARGLVDGARAAEITAHLKARPFWERTAEALFAAPAFCSLSPPDRERLGAFFAEKSIDVKRRDAALALAEVARREQEPPPSIQLSPAGASHYDRFRLLKRGFSRGAGGAPIDGAELVERLVSDPARRRLLRWSLSARFFLTQWALHAQVAAPDTTVLSSPPPLDWLRANALSAAEHAALGGRQELAGWLLAQPPEAFGHASILQDEALLPAVPELDLEALRSVCSRQALARALPWVAAWCDCVGAAPPPEDHATWAARWRDALAMLAARGQPADCARFLAAVWAIDRGPVHFGHATWSFAAELLSLLQWTGAAAALAAREQATGA